MNSEVGRLDGQRFLQMTRWATLAGDWILPVSLAVVIAGQIYFSAARFYLGIEHPAWLFWGLLAAGVVLGILRAMPTFQATRADMAMLGFVLVMTASFLIYGLGDSSMAFYYIGAFMLLPYLAGRLLDVTCINRFMNATVYVAVAAVPLIGIGLLSLPESKLQTDRIKTLFATSDGSRFAELYTIPHADLALGLLLVLSVSSLSTFGFDRMGRRQFFYVAFMCCAAWLLIFVGLRGTILSALLICFISLVFGCGPTLRRIALLCTLCSVVVASWVMLPIERKVHFGQMGSTQAASGSTQKDLGSTCKVYGNSVATRVHLYNSALLAFLSSPWIGVGAGNYGFEAYCGSNETFGSPHSTLLQVLAELGLIGAIVYLSLVGITLYGLMQIVMRGTGQRRSLAWLLASVWCLFFLQDQISGNYFTSYHFFAATGLISGLSVTSATRRQR